MNAQVSESSSEIAVPGYTETDYNTLERTPLPAPKMMTIEDIERFKQQILTAADLALNVAGFDFFELHGAHGYLLDQFLNAGTNTRTDQYGGSYENRFRLIAELLELLIPKYPGRIAIRISPHSGTGFFDANDPKPLELYTEVYRRLAKYDLAYLLCTEPRWNPAHQGNPETDPFWNLPMFSAQFTKVFRETNKTTVIIGAGGFTADNSFETMKIENDRPYDAVGYGRFYISNPDIVFRLKHYLPFNRYNRSSFYTVAPFGGDFNAGYTDYPTFEQIVKAKLGPDADLAEVIANPDTIAKLIELTKDDLYPLIPLDIIGKTRSTAEREGSESATAAEEAPASE